MDRVEIKNEAKEIIKTNKWNVWKPTLVIALISLIFTLIALIIGTLFNTDSELVSSITESILSFALLPTTVGILAYYLKIIRKEEFSLDDLKAYYPFFLKILLLDVLVAVFVLLWSLLLIIPGIIAAISYTMVFYLCVDKKDLDALETISESKKMMKGYKMDYFIFKLSFIGWILLMPFTLGLILIWLVPYVVIADALFYDKLQAKYNKKKSSK